MVEAWNTQAFREKLRETGQTVVVDFYTDWCPSCRTLSVLLEQIAREWEGKPVCFGKVNGEEEPALAREYEIRSVPTVIVLRDGVPVARSVGAIGKSKLNGMILAGTEEASRSGDPVLP